jgi:hypothetical protein
MDKINAKDNFKEILKKFDTKHLAVIDRMAIDIKKRMIRGESNSLIDFYKPSLSKTKDIHRKNFSKQFNNTHQTKDYPCLGDFYLRLSQDIKKREITSKIRLQIKKILDKQKYKPCFNRNDSISKPHLPHKYASEELEIEKIYGLPGKPK